MSTASSSAMYAEVDSRRIPLIRGMLYIFGKLPTRSPDGYDHKIILDDKDLDEKHCSLINSEDGCFVVDLLSKNGTFLNGKRLETCVKTLVCPGDVIDLARKQKITLQLEGSESSHDSSGYIENCRNTSDIINSSPVQSTSQRDVRLKRLYGHTSDDNDSSVFLVPAIPSLSKPSSYSSQSSSNKNIHTPAKATSTSTRRAPEIESPNGGNNSDNDSFSIPETQYLQPIPSLASNLEDDSESETDEKSVKFDCNLNALGYAGDSDDDDDFFIPETQDVASNDRPRSFGNSNKLDKIAEISSAEDRELEESQFRICTQDYNDSQSPTGNETLNSQIIPLIKHKPVVFSVPGASSSCLKDSAANVLRAEEDEDLANVIWSEAEEAINNNSVQSICSTPDLLEFDVFDKMQAECANDQDEQDLLPTQKLPLAAEINGSTNEKKQKIEDVDVVDAKNSEPFVSLSDKENMQPIQLEPVTDVPPSQLFAGNEAVNPELVNEDPLVSNKKLSKPESMDEDDDILTQALLQPSKPVTLQPNVINNNCFNSTLLDDKAPNKNPTKFFEEIEKTSRQSHTSGQRRSLSLSSAGANKSILSFSRSSSVANEIGSKENETSKSAIKERSTSSPAIVAAKTKLSTSSAASKEPLKTKTMMTMTTPSKNSSESDGDFLQFMTPRVLKEMKFTYVPAKVKSDSMNSKFNPDNEVDVDTLPRSGQEPKIKNCLVELYKVPMSYEFKELVPTPKGTSNEEEWNDQVNLDTYITFYEEANNCSRIKPKRNLLGEYREPEELSWSGKKSKLSRDERHIARDRSRAERDKKSSSGSEEVNSKKKNQEDSQNKINKKSSKGAQSEKDDNRKDKVEAKELRVGSKAKEQEEHKINKDEDARKRKGKLSTKEKQTSSESQGECGGDASTAGETELKDVQKKQRLRRHPNADAPAADDFDLMPTQPFVRLNRLPPNSSLIEEDDCDRKNNTNLDEKSEAKSKTDERKSNSTTPNGKRMSDDLDNAKLKCAEMPASDEIDLIPTQPFVRKTRSRANSCRNESADERRKNEKDKKAKTRNAEKKSAATDTAGNKDNERQKAKSREDKETPEKIKDSVKKSTASSSDRKRKANDADSSRLMSIITISDDEIDLMPTQPLIRRASSRSNSKRNERSRETSPIDRLNRSTSRKTAKDSTKESVGKAKETEKLTSISAEKKQTTLPAADTSLSKPKSTKMALDEMDLMPTQPIVRRTRSSRDRSKESLRKAATSLRPDKENLTKSKVVESKSSYHSKNNSNEMSRTKATTRSARSPASRQKESSSKRSSSAHKTEAKYDETMTKVAERKRKNDDSRSSSRIIEKRSKAAPTLELTDNSRIKQFKPPECLISTSLLDPEDLARLKSEANGIWAIAKNPIHSDVLVMDQANRTFKFLLAVARGLPIVTSAWLREVNRQKSVRSVKKEDYQFSCSHFEKRHKFNLQKSLQRARTSPCHLFRNYHFVMTANIQPNTNEMKEIIIASGGKVYERVPAPSEDIQNMFLLSSETDRKTWHRYRRLNPAIKIISTEAVMTSVLRQNCDPLCNHMLG